MKIGCYIGAWTYNIGNAFFDLGLEYVLKKAFPDARLYPMGGSVRYLFNHNSWGKRYADRSFEIGEVADIDILAYAGMAICNEFVDDNGATFINAAKRGVAILGVGIGALRYTAQEADYYTMFINKLPKYAMVTRDDDTFSMFDGKIAHVYRGIDNAFSLGYAYSPPKLRLGEYDVMNFDANFIAKVPEIPGRDIIYTHHKFAADLPEPFYQKPNTLISDMPWDYLALYANCCTTYTDRVHACIASLSYGNKAMLFNKTPRKSLFAKFNLSEITEHPCALDMNLMEEQVNNQINVVRQAVTDMM